MGNRRNPKKGSGGGEPSAASDIPPGAREMVERVKEVVDRQEFEIYAALKDCKMELNDAIDRLMSQVGELETSSGRREGQDKGKSWELMMERALES